MSDTEDLMIADLRMMAEKGPLRIDPAKDQQRVLRWVRASEWGWIEYGRDHDGMVSGMITDTGRGHLALQPKPRVPEPIEGTISPWMPLTDPKQLAVIGKLGEECNELGARIFRCIIQGGFEELDPDTGRTNREEMIREISDVEACISWLRDETKIMADGPRMAGKLNGFRRWMRKIKDILSGGDGSAE